MLKKLKTAALRSDTFIEDMTGCTALVVLLFAALHFPVIA